MKEYILFWKNYFNFKGETTRKEYWIPQLINGVILAVIILCGGSTIFKVLNEVFLGSGEIYVNETEYKMTMNILYIVSTVLFIIVIPSISISIRRFRDAGVNWYWYLILAFALSVFTEITGLSNQFVSLVSAIFLIVQLVILVMPSNLLKKNIFLNQSIKNENYLVLFSNKIYFMLIDVEISQ